MLLVTPANMRLKSALRQRIFSLNALKIVDAELHELRWRTDAPQRAETAPSETPSVCEGQKLINRKLGLCGYQRSRFWHSNKEIRR
jgi:hypothetical protein